MSEQPRPAFWFAWVKLGDEEVPFAVSAFTERSAKVQIRKRLRVSRPNTTPLIMSLTPVTHAHAWAVNLAG